jgi:peptidoglycan hydrolase-like protein with peptidoglycan-binding domain
VIRVGLRLATAACVGLTVVGCSSDGAGDGDGAVRLAQAQVDGAKANLTAARDDAAAAASDFCGQGGDYLVALNRYGGVMTTRAVTVGDVRDAGTDLAAPAQDVSDSADAAVAARDEVTAAEQELAAAKADLAAARSTTPTPTPSSKATELVPTASAASVNRVEQAEAELDSAVEGITDETPLAQASEQLNAAAVALEMSWLGLLSEVGCLTDEQQAKAAEAVSDYTTTLQQSLALTGYYTATVDGVYGPATVDAVEALQKQHGLPVTGAMDAATSAALDAEVADLGGDAAEQSVATAAAVQQTLRLAGFWSGPVDGEWTPALTEALEDFQTELGVEPSGVADAATVAALERAIAELQAEAEETPSATPSETGGADEDPDAGPTDTASP